MTKGIINIKEYIDKGYSEDHSTIIIPKDNSDFDFPINKYKIIGHAYKYSTDKIKYWDVSSYEILKFNQESNNFEKYIEFGRNYRLMKEDMFVYCIQNNKEYIITSSDYQYITIINLTDKEINSYSYGNPDKGYGFCPVSIQYFQNKDNNLSNELKVYGCFWGAPYETLIIKNVDLNDLSNSYNIKNNDILRIEDESEEIYNIEDILTDDELTKYELFNIDEGMIYNTIKAIKDNQYFNSSKDKKEYFNNIIIKALLYYFDNVL